MGPGERTVAHSTQEMGWILMTECGLYRSAAAAGRSSQSRAVPPAGEKKGL